MKYKLKGSSLIETVIAISIITICSLIATLVYGQVVPATPPVKKYEWTAELNKIMEKNMNADFIPFKNKYEGYSIEGKIISIGDGRLSHIEYIVIAQNDTLATHMLNYNENIDEF